MRTVFAFSVFFKMLSDMFLAGRVERGLSATGRGCRMGRVSHFRNHVVRLIERTRARNRDISATGTYKTSNCHGSVEGREDGLGQVVGDGAAQCTRGVNNSCVTGGTIPQD